MSCNKDDSIQYGFHGRLNAEFPSQVIVDATEVCNLGCVHCPHPEFKKSEHFAARYLSPELNAKMVDEVSKHSKQCQYIRYTSNGEPLIHPQIFEMLDYAVERSNTWVTVTTNGTIMKERRVENLLASGLHLVDVSIDAVKEDTYSAIRVGGDLKKTRANVIRLLELRDQAKAKTKIVVSFVEQPNNKEEAADFKSFWEDKGADFVIIRRLHSAAGGVAGLAKSQRDANEKTTRYPCLYPWERILLNPRGELAFCPQDWSHGSVIAPYSETSIADTWNGEFYRKLREAHLANQYCDHKFCGQCPDWAQTRWPNQGRSYADLVAEFKGEPA